MKSPLWTSIEAVSATLGKCTQDWSVQGLSIDTRSLQTGDLFIALKDFRDGHDFLTQAAKSGALAALVDHRPQNAPKELPLLVVKDTLAALEDLARAARIRNFGKIIAVTGSAGKTSTKEMLRHALAPLGYVHAAERSFNNHIGVPFTLASLPCAADFGVFEIGMNHPGEITPLGGMVAPSVAIITTIAAAHLAQFSSVDEIAQAKAEIFSGVTPGGAVVLPADNPFYEFLVDAAKKSGITRIIPFGKSAAANGGVQLHRFEDGQVVLEVAREPLEFSLNAQGEHQAMNAAAVIATGVALGADYAVMATGLGTFCAGAGRGALHELSLEGQNITLIDESYNANPASMTAAIQVLAQAKLGLRGRRIAVLGEMKELGAGSPQLHADLAEPLTDAQVDLVFTTGADMLALEAALPREKSADHADSAIALLEPILATLREGDVVLFKGSNASQVGKLVNAILAKASEAV